MNFNLITIYNNYKIPLDNLRHSGFLNKYNKETNKYEITLEEKYYTDDVIKIILKYIENIDETQFLFNEEIYDDINFLFNMIVAADFLEIEYLYKKYRKILIDIINETRSADDFRSRFDIKDDLDEKEKNKIMFENVWGNKKENSSNNLNFSTFIDTKKFDKITSTPPNDITRFIKKRKLIRPIEDETVEKCYKCEELFTLINRKHHCRSCGRIFCGLCSGRKIVLLDEDKSLLSYDASTYSNILNSLTSAQVRVCDKCFVNISDQKSYSDIIIKFKVISFRMDDLKKLATICHKWRKASIWCLSSLRELQYTLPTKEFDKFEKRALWTNRNAWIGHSQWMFQLCRVIDYDNEYMRNILFDMLSKEKKIDCYKTMCSRLCYPTLQPRNFIYMLGKSCTNQEMRDFAVSVIEQALDEEKDLYLVSLINNIKYENTLNNSKLIDMINTMALSDINTCGKILWITSSFTDNKYKHIYSYVLQHLIINSVVKNNNNANSIKKILNSYYFFLKMENIKNDEICNLIKMFNNDFVYPFNSLININNILHKEITVKESATAPLLIPIIDANNNKKFILFKNDDIRSDVIILNIIKIMKTILDNDSYTKDMGIPVKTYDILSVNSKCGIIEVVQSASTLYEIIKNGSINTFLINNNHNKKIGDVYNNYTTSLAFWTVATHLLGIGDRHLDNIMMTNDGVIFHIDYSFILGQNPNSIIPLIRMTQELIEGLGGYDKYKQFKELCSKIFITLRRHSILFFNLLTQLSEFDPPIKNGIYTPKYLEEQLINRFLTGQNDNDATETLNYLIDQSCDTFLGNLTDYLHHFSKKSPIVKSASSLIGSFGNNFFNYFSWNK